MSNEYVNRPPAGWFALTVCPQGKQEKPSDDWVGLFIDVDPDQPRAGRVACEVWVRVPGKHFDQDAAWEALLDLMETRH